MAAVKDRVTNLYNRRPDWLRHAHDELDFAVAAAYGWTDYTPGMTDDELLRRLLALNLQRVAVQERLPFYKEALSPRDIESDHRAPTLGAQTK